MKDLRLQSGAPELVASESKVGASPFSGAFGKLLRMGVAASALAVFDGAQNTAQADVGTWSTGQSVDAEMGTNYDAQGYVVAFAGTPGGLSYVSVYDSSGNQYVLETRDGLSFTDVTADIQVLDSGVVGDTFVTGYAPDQDAAFLDSGTAYRIDNFSGGVSAWVLTETNSSSSGYGSVDNATNEVYLADYNRGDEQLYNDTISAVLYNASGNSDIDPIVDTENDRFFYTNNTDGSNNYATARDGLGNVVVLGSEDSYANQYLPPSSSVTGYPEVVYSDDFSLKFAYQTDYAEEPLDSDGDGDGVPDGDDAFPDDSSESVDADLDGVGAVADCDDNDPDRFPDNTNIDTADGVDNDCESSTPSVGRLTIGGLEVYPMITAEPIHFAVGESIPLEATGEDDETLSSGMTYEWRIQKPDGGYETLIGASTEFTPEDNGDYSVTLIIRDADGEEVTDAGNNFTANFSADALEGAELEDGDMIYEDPTDPDSASAEVHGDPYVDAEGNIHLDDEGDGVSVDGASLVVESEGSEVVLTTGGETHTGIFLGGSDHVEFAPAPPPSEGYGPYVDTTDTRLMTYVNHESGDLRVVSSNTWEGNSGPELDLVVSNSGEYWFADTQDDTPDGGPNDTGGDDTGETGETGNEDTDGGENPETGTPDSGEKVDNKPDDGQKTGCSTAPGGAEWYGLGLGALALAGRRRRK